MTGRTRLAPREWWMAAPAGPHLASQPQAPSKELRAGSHATPPAPSKPRWRFSSKPRDATPQTPPAGAAGEPNAPGEDAWATVLVSGRASRRPSDWWVVAGGSGQGPSAAPALSDRRKGLKRLREGAGDGGRGSAKRRVGGVESKATGRGEAGQLARRGRERDVEGDEGSGERGVRGGEASARGVGVRVGGAGGLAEEKGSLLGGEKSPEGIDDATGSPDEATEGGDGDGDGGEREEVEEECGDGERLGGEGDEGDADMEGIRGPVEGPRGVGESGDGEEGNTPRDAATAPTDPLATSCDPAAPRDPLAFPGSDSESGGAGDGVGGSGNDEGAYGDAYDFAEHVRTVRLARRRATARARRPRPRLSTDAFSPRQGADGALQHAQHTQLVQAATQPMPQTVQDDQPTRPAQQPVSVPEPSQPLPTPSQPAEGALQDPEPLRPSGEAPQRSHPPSSQGVRLRRSARRSGGGGGGGGGDAGLGKQMQMSGEGSAAGEDEAPRVRAGRRGKGRRSDGGGAGTAAAGDAGEGAAAGDAGDGGAAMAGVVVAANATDTVGAERDGADTAADLATTAAGVTPTVPTTSNAVSDGPLLDSTPRVLSPATPASAPASAGPPSATTLVPSALRRLRGLSSAHAGPSPPPLPTALRPAVGAPSPAVVWALSLALQGATPDQSPATGRGRAGRGDAGAAKEGGAVVRVLDFDDGAGRGEGGGDGVAGRGEGSEGEGMGGSGEGGGERGVGGAGEGAGSGSGEGREEGFVADAGDGPSSAAKSGKGRGRRGGGKARTGVAKAAAGSAAGPGRPALRRSARAATRVATMASDAAVGQGKRGEGVAGGVAVDAEAEAGAAPVSPAHEASPTPQQPPLALHDTSAVQHGSPPRVASPTPTAAVASASTPSTPLPATSPPSHVLNSDVCMGPSLAPPHPAFPWGSPGVATPPNPRLEAAMLALTMPGPRETIDDILGYDTGCGAALHDASGALEGAEGACQGAEWDSGRVESGTGVPGGVGSGGVGAGCGGDNRGARVGGVGESVEARDGSPEVGTPPMDRAALLRAPGVAEEGGGVATPVAPRLGRDAGDCGASGGDGCEDLAMRSVVSPPLRLPGGGGEGDVAVSMAETGTPSATTPHAHSPSPSVPRPVSPLSAAGIVRVAFDEAAGAHVVRRARADVVPGGPGRLHYHRQIMKEQSMRDQSIWEHVTVRGTVAGASGASAAGADAVGESDGGAVVGDAMGADAVGVDAVAGAFVQWYVNEKLAVKWRAGEAWASTDRCGLVMDDARAADIRKRWTEAAVAAQQALPPARVSALIEASECEWAALRAIREASLRRSHRPPRTHATHATHSTHAHHPRGATSPSPSKGHARPHRSILRPARAACAKRASGCGGCGGRLASGVQRRVSWCREDAVLRVGEV